MQQHLSYVLMLGARQAYPKISAPDVRLDCESLDAFVVATLLALRANCHC